MTEDEERAEAIKRRNVDRLEDDGMMTHMLFMAAAMSSGQNAIGADKAAAQAVALLKSRFT